MNVEVLIRGEGSVGRCLALALASQGLQVGLLGPARREPQEGDVRAYALNAASQALLARLKVWDGLPEAARTPVLDMRVQMDGGRLDFSAWQSQTEQLAWIVDAAELDQQLDNALRFAPHVRRLEQEVPHGLLALCEGREAATRQQLGVSVQQRPYGHDAIATRLVAAEPHQGRAWQWFTEGGEILALLPLDRPEPGCSYALVWSQPSELASQRMALSAEAFEAALQPLCGMQLRLAGSRQRWPLRWLRANTVAGPGFVLLGDCAHLVHPLAGQGLNLGLADVSALAQVLAAREPWRALGDAKLLRRYERARAADTLLVGELCDSLWLGLTQAPAWTRPLAAQGLGLVNRLSPLKRWLSQRAMGAPTAR